MLIFELQYFKHKISIKKIRRYKIESDEYMNHSVAQILLIIFPYFFRKK